MATLIERIDTWHAAMSAALDTLSMAEQDVMHAGYALAEARAVAETAIRAAASDKKPTEHAIEIAVTLAHDVRICEGELLDTRAALITAQARVEALKAEGRALDWLVRLTAGAPLPTAA